MTDLRTLPFLKLSNETGPKIEELRGLNQLPDTLSLSGLENVGDGKEAQKANLVEKKHIRKLILAWTLDRRRRQNVENEDHVLGGLKPHSSLVFLEIQGFMGVKFPSWLLEANNLKEIELVGCNNSEGVPVLGHLPNLTYVKIKRMEHLTCIGSEFYGDNLVNCGNGSSTEARPLFPALKTLHIEKAPNLTEWMEAPRERGSMVFPCLEELTLRSCGRLTSAPSHFPSLKALVIEDMRSGGMPISSIMSNQLTTLTYLKLSQVSGLTCLPKGMLENNKNLAHLKIDGCRELTCISPRSQGREYCCASLSYLWIMSCGKLRYLPNGILTPSLKTLGLSYCYDLKYIPDATDGGLTSLETLRVSDCYKITSIPFSQGLPSLGELIIDSCPELSSLPGGLENCTSIRSLEIRFCPKVPSISIGSLTTSLQELSVSNLDCLPISPKGFPALQAMPQLESLTIHGWGKLKSLPEQIQHLPSLRHLRIEFFDGVEAIPEWLGDVASLEHLEVTFCKSLKYLPSEEAMQRLTKLKQIYIFACDLLEERCREETGQEWPKIRHLPFIKIGDTDIENDN